MKNSNLLLWIALLAFSVSGLRAATPAPGGEYTLVVEGYDWGPAVSKIILSLDESVNSVDGKNYKVLVKRSTECTQLPAGQAFGNRDVVFAYVSDEKGNRIAEGRHVTLVMAVAPNDPLGSPIQYTRGEKCRGNNWIDYTVNVREESKAREWNKASGRMIMPLIDRFDLSGKFTHQDITMSYASYTPQRATGKSPLIIWLHGGGEGGTDPSIPLIANRAANYASDEIQALFGGAFVLSPQSPTYWMDNGEGGMTSGKVNDIYNEALMALIQDFVKSHPQVDQNRIYVGGCSNGGYMTLKLLLQHPKYFAAAFPSALAYQSEYLTDDQIKSIKNIPIWFVQSKDDPVTIPDQTVVPVYDRLVKAGAPNVHFTFYDHVVDITGFYGGAGYQYNGHWSWIYCHANDCRRNLDGSLVMLNGRPVTIMEWLAAQTMAKGKRK